MKFVIPLVTNPVPYQNELKHTRTGHTYKTKKLTHYQYHLGLVCKSEMIRNGWEKLVNKNFRMEVVFFCRDKKRGDRTNMLKSIEDALEGIAYDDDWYSIDGTIQIRYDKENPRIEIYVTPLK